MVAKAILAALVLCVPLSRAAGPTNDICAGAEAIPGNAGALSPYYTSIKDITLAGTVGDPVASCQEFVARSVWYSFTPNTNAIYTIAACNDPMAPTATTVSDTVMAIYRSAGGCAGPFVQVACNDDACGPGDGLQSAITQQLLADTTYYIVVWQYFDPLDPPSMGGVVQLRVTRAIRPSNDTCAAPIQVPLDFPVTGTTVGADDNYQLPAGNACFTGPGHVPSTASGRDVVYSFVAPRAGDYSFRVFNYSVQNNLVIYVAGSCPPAGNPAIVTTCLGAANRSSASSAEEVVCVSLAANQRVFVFVDEHAFTAGSSFAFQVNQCFREREPNNTWMTATFLACGMAGAIDPSGDIDFFHLGRPAPGSRAFVMIDGEAASTTDFDLRLTTATDTLDYDDQDNDTSFGTFSPNIAGCIMPGGSVYARVDFRGQPTEPYHIYAVVQPPMAQAAVESEPNGTLAEADFSESAYYYGVLQSPADVDVFTFTAEGTELLFVSLDADPTRTNSPIQAKLELLDEFGNILVTVDDGNSLSSTNTTTGTLTATSPRSPSEAFVYRVINDGTYYVRVTISPQTTGPASAGDYLLSIAKNCYTGSSGFLDSPMTLSPISAPPIFEGSQATLSGTLQDPDSWQLHRVVVNWGDGSATTNYFGGGIHNFAIPHFYADDNPTGTSVDQYPVQMTATDSSGASLVRNTSVTISNAAPMVFNLAITSPVLTNETATLSGAVFEPGLDPVALAINWGDGTAIQTANFGSGTNVFNFTHHYAAAGSNHVTVTFQDDDAGVTTASLPVIVRLASGAAATLGSLTRSTEGVVMLVLQGTPNATYHLEYSTNLMTWHALPAQPADNNGRIVFNDPGATNAWRFYRAVSP